MGRWLGRDGARDTATNCTRLVATIGVLGVMMSWPQGLVAQAPRPPPQPIKVAMGERLGILKRTYPDLVYSQTRNVLRTVSNRQLVIDDGRAKAHWAKLRDADIEDQLSQVYPLGKCFRGRVRNIDPGQMRNDAFFRLAYGANEYLVTRETETIDWFGTPVRFSRRHGAAAALRRVRDDLATLPAKTREAVAPIGRGLDRAEVPDRDMPDRDMPDVHAFGIAIDIAAAVAQRWRYIGQKARRLAQIRKQVPPEVVEVFERHGFIWGGKWYHFETAHFEYRPELIAIGRLALERGCEPVRAGP